jgi:putative ABC transport system substrate-binding protein
VRSKVEVIVARTNLPTQAAMKATQSIPIVMLNGNFPVENGFVKSLARPGGNVTGTSYWPSTEIFGKHFQILKELAPRTDRVAVPFNARWTGDPVTLATQAAMKRAADQLGMTLHYFDYRQPEDITAALNAIAASGIKAMFYNGDPVMRTRTAEIMAFLRDQRMASIATIATFAEAGGLAHFAPNLDHFERTASYVDRILRGAKPADLPVEEPTSFEFVINLKTAKAIGLVIPQSALVRATAVIE